MRRIDKPWTEGDNGSEPVGARGRDGEGMRACRGGQSRRGPVAPRPTCRSSRGSSRACVGQASFRGGPCCVHPRHGQCGQGLGLPRLPCPPAPGSPVCAAMPYISSAHMPSPSPLLSTFFLLLSCYYKGRWSGNSSRNSIICPFCVPHRSCSRAPSLSAGGCDMGL